MSRPYTLPLKHYEWVRKEISTLERAGIITKSISPWASPVVIVPKKSAPGEPPQRRMCVDFRKLNKTQPEVHNMNGGKGCISLVPLPKIDELYAKLQGYTFSPHWTSVLDTITLDSHTAPNQKQPL